jgi:ASC-1-like (ASCH) protein
MKNVKIGIRDKNKVDVREGDIVIFQSKNKYEVIYSLEKFGRCDFILWSESLDECIPMMSGMEKYLEVMGSAYDD